MGDVEYSKSAMIEILDGMKRSVYQGAAKALIIVVAYSERRDDSDLKSASLTVDTTKKYANVLEEAVLRLSSGEVNIRDPRVAHHEDREGFDKQKWMEWFVERTGGIDEVPRSLGDDQKCGSCHWFCGTLAALEGEGKASGEDDGYGTCRVDNPLPVGFPVAHKLGWCRKWRRAE